jgi:hypothetical protein
MAFVPVLQVKGEASVSLLMVAARCLLLLL